MAVLGSKRGWLAVSIGMVVGAAVACGQTEDAPPDAGAGGEGGDAAELAGGQSNGAAGAGGAVASADRNQDNVADDLGKIVDNDGDGVADLIDINGDGKLDGFGIDTNDDGKVDALALDPDCDGFYEAEDTDGDGKPDLVSRLKPVGATTNCKLPNIDGSGGAAIGGSGSGGGSGEGGRNSGGTAGTSAGVSGATNGGAAGTGGGGASSGGMAGTGGNGGSASGELGQGVFQGTGESSDQYAEADVYRDGVGYKFIANGWGTSWKSHTISWNGTSFTVKELSGAQGSDYSPAGYPTMFCGLYSNKESIGTCGLPGAIAALKSIRTGWRWNANGNEGQYNAAWDIWLGNGADAASFSSYLMVWLRDPPGQQPAGAVAVPSAKVTGLPGTWNIWAGSVNGHPIVSYVRTEGQDLYELELDVLAVYKDAKARNLNLPGSYVQGVAIGYEVWNGPLANLATEDFYVDVK